MYKVAICDDNHDYVENLEKLLRDLHPGKMEVYKYFSVEALLVDMERLHHLVLVNLGVHGLIERKILRSFRKVNISGMLVVISGGNVVPIDILNYNPAHYLLRNYSKDKLCQELKIILEKLVKPQDEVVLSVKGDQNLFQVKASDISYISKIKNGSQIHVVRERRPDLECKLVTRLHLRELYKTLHDLGFEFAHDSYLVNCRWVERLEARKFLILKDNIGLNVSRSRQLSFGKAMVAFWGNKNKRDE